MSDETNAIEDAQEVQTAVPGISPYYKTIDDTKQVTALVHAEDDGSFSVFKRPALEQKPVHIVLQNLQEVQSALSGQLLPSTPTEFEDMLVNQWGHDQVELREEIPTNTVEEETQRDAVDANNAANNPEQTDETGASVQEPVAVDAPDVGSDVGTPETGEAIIDEKLVEPVAEETADSAK